MTPRTTTSPSESVAYGFSTMPHAIFGDAVADEAPTRLRRLVAALSQQNPI